MEIDIIEEYKILNKIKPIGKENIFINALLKANIEWEFEDILSCKKNIESAIDNIIIKSDTFSTLLKLSIFIGEFNKLISKIDCKYLNLDDSKILNEVFKRYYTSISLGKKFEVSHLFEKCTSSEDKSVILYLIATINEEEKQEFLIASLKEEKKNLSVIKELYNLNYRLSINELNYLYKIDQTLFYSNQFEISEKILNFSFKPLGGGNSIGASSYLFDINGTKLLVDCGIKFENNEVIFPNYSDNIHEIKACNLCIITHAHLDHCGSIFKIYELNKSIRFIMTKETRELLKINLENIIDNKYLFDDLFKRILILDFNKPYQWRESDLTIELYRAGHILGASSIFFKTKECNVFITGDYCIENQKTVNGIQVPSNEKIDILITENTYGNKDIKDILSRKMIYEQFKKYVVDKIKLGKKILIPAFAIGRSQELVSLLKDVAEKNNFRIYIDGASIKTSHLYSRYGFNISSKNVHYVKSDIYDSKEDFILQEFMNNKSCVITSSGMLQEGSTSATYARYLLGESNVVCILTGYQSGNTIGSRLKEQFRLDADRYIVIEEENININCELNEFHLSAHCMNTDIMAITKYLNPKNVILVHGDIKDENKSKIYKILENNRKINVIQSKDNILIKL